MLSSSSFYATCRSLLAVSIALFLQAAAFAWPFGTNGGYFDASISGNGRYIATGTAASGLWPGDPPGTGDVFRLDTQTGDILLVSVNSEGEQGNDTSVNPSISADGNRVAFTSKATNFAAGDTNATWDVFVRDIAAGTTTRVSVDSTGSQSNGQSAASSISGDGSRVAFNSTASNLVTGDTNGATDVFVRDISNGTTVRASVSSSEIQGENDSYYPTISANGNCVAFISDSTSLVTSDTNGFSDAFVRNLAAGTTVRVSIDSAGVQGNNIVDASLHRRASINSNGTRVAFGSHASNLVAGDTNLTTDVFLHDISARTTIRINVVDVTGVQGNNYHSGGPSISGDGNRVAFWSDVTNLVPNDTNQVGDVFVRDIVAGTTRRVSVNSAGVQGDSTSGFPTISTNGNHVSFRSSAKNLVPLPNVESGIIYSQIYVHDLTTGITVGPSPPPSAACDWSWYE